MIAIVPLVPLDPTKNGGTHQFVHISRLRDTELRTRPAIADAGDAYVYDLRARHGGLPHSGSAPMAAVVATLRGRTGTWTP